MLLNLAWTPTLVMYPTIPAIKITAITFLASSAIALIASDRARSKDWLYASSPFSKLSPPGWFAGVLILWPVFYPAFLHSHYKIMNRRRMIFGFITGLLFIVTLLWILLVSRNRLPEWPVQSKPSAAETATPSPNTISQAPLEATQAPASFPVTIPSLSSPLTTAPQQLADPLSASRGTSGQNNSLSNSSSSAPSFAPYQAPAPAPPAPVPPAPASPAPPPGHSPGNNSDSAFPLLSVEIIRQGAP